MLTLATLPMPAIGMKNIKELTLTDSLVLDQWIVPKGATVKVFQTRDAGYVCLPADTKDHRGFTIPRRLFRY